MNRSAIQKSLMGVVAAIALLALGAAAALWWTARSHDADQPTGMASEPQADGRTVLYWYDPMYPQQKFDKPGKSPFMDMELVPKYADEGADAASVKIDPQVAQNLGVRLATVTRGALDAEVQATGVVGFNERDVVIVQARSGGFVERVARLAPDDVVGRGAWIAEILVPEWAALQQEYLALRGMGETALEAAARERMLLGGMPPALIAEVAKTGKIRNRITITTPRGGVVQALEVRPGMTVMAGQTLARINGIGTVWLDVAVPEAQAPAVRVGQTVAADFPAFPGAPVTGRITALLPTLDADARALRARVELPNRDGRLRPGLTARVTLKGEIGEAVLRVPTEAVIRTGRRALVIVAEEGGRYRPVEVELGPESGGQTAIVSGLEEGQKIVASGQFLIDSEASMQGIVARGATPETAMPAPAALHEADAVIDEISGEYVTLSHEPFKTLSMPGMTMEFPLANPGVAQGMKPGDRVRVGVRETDEGLLVEKMQRKGGAE